MEDPKIEYSVKELLAKVEARMGDVFQQMSAGFAAIQTKLDGKADRSDVEKLHEELKTLGGRTEMLEGWRRDTEAALHVHEARDAQTDRKRNWRLGLAGLAGVGLVVLSSVLTAVLR